jgi:hypothetical protein
VQLELIVASPLTRTLETAAGCLGGLVFASGTAAARDQSDGGNVLMNAIADSQGFSAAHEAVLCPDVPIVAHELCRETLEIEPCCKRRTITEIAKQFPGVDFSLIETDHDALWDEDKRETEQEVRVRPACEQVVELVAVRQGCMANSAMPHAKR